jgi:hypothetical protein
MSGYEVAIVLVAELPGLRDLASKTHVWAPENAANKIIAETTKAQPPQRWNDCGVTLYYDDGSETAEEKLLSLLETIDLHHGEYRHDPPWTALRIYGLDATSTVREALAQFGVDTFTEFDGGFCARR